MSDFQSRSFKYLYFIALDFVKYALQDFIQFTICDAMIHVLAMGGDLWETLQSDLQSNIVQEKEEEDEKTEEQKAAERARPVSSTPVPGTPW